MDSKYILDTENVGINVSMLNSIDKNLLKVTLISYANVVFNISILCIIISIITYTSSLLNDSNKILNEGSESLKDINIIIPDIKQTLNILKSLCHKYPVYCNNNTIV